MSRRKRPPRRMTVFRCPEELHREIEPYFSFFNGGRSAYMVASLLAMLTKLGKEGVVDEAPRVPEPEADVLRSFQHFRKPGI